jgi:hypothetical protein
VAIEDAQEAPDDMLGTFLVNATTAIVLFGARASHSFISATYIEKHNLPISMLKCRGWGGGVNGTINLIVLHSKRIHVIPRMDWLRKHKVLIDDRRVRPNLQKDKSIEWRS